MNEQLKPCPYCGNTTEIKSTARGNFFFITCDSCSATGPVDLGISGAVEQWQTRPIEDTLRVQLAAMTAERDVKQEVLQQVFNLLEEHEPNWYLRLHYNAMLKVGCVEVES